MKTINNFIDEKLKISSKSNFYSCQPKDKFELRKILEERLAEDKNANLNDINVSQITDMGDELPDNKGLFHNLDPHDIDISEWDVSNVTNMRFMFSDCINFTGKGLENWDVSNVKRMPCMFSYCINFTGKGLENWNVSNVTNMCGMFLECQNFNADLSDWDVSKVTDMHSMFAGCEKFTGKGLENWDVSNLTNSYDMHYMFRNCNSLKNKPSWYEE